MESNSDTDLTNAEQTIDRMRQQVNTDAKLLEDDIDLASELEEDRFKKLEPFINECRILRDEYLKTMKLSAYALREEVARDKLTEMSVEHEGYFKAIDSAINIAGVMTKPDYLDILHVSKEAYDNGVETNPLVLLGIIRQAYQSNVRGIRQLWKNAMPIDYELLDKAKPEDMPDMFKTVVLGALREAEKDYALMHNPKVRKIVELREPWVKTIEYSVALEMQGEALVDATNPIYRATDTRLEKIGQAIKDKQKELDLVDSRLSPKQKEEGIIDERIRIKRLDEDTIDKRLQQKRTEYEELIKQMMQMQNPEQQVPEAGDAQQ